MKTKKTVRWIVLAGLLLSAMGAVAQTRYPDSLTVEIAYRIIYTYRPPWGPPPQTDTIKTFMVSTWYWPERILHDTVWTDTTVYGDGK